MTTETTVEREPVTESGTATDEQLITMLVQRARENGL